MDNRRGCWACRCGKRLWSGLLPLFSVAALLMFAAPFLSAQAMPPAQTQPRVSPVMAARQLSRLPIGFEANTGRFDPRVRFVSRSGAATMFLTDTGLTMVLPGKEPTQPAGMPRSLEQARRGPGQVVRMALAGARPHSRSVGLRKLPGVVNYLIGKDRTKWRTGVPTYAQARFQGVYPGTDLVYYSNGNRLEYDFVLGPKADPGKVRLAFEGVDSLRVAANGDLIAATPAGDLQLRRPYAYQAVNGMRVQVACDYSLSPGSRQAGLRLAHYDAARPLVVDPELVYATYLGGSGLSRITGAAITSTGQAVVTGYTQATNFPTTAGAYSAARNGTQDLFVSRLNSAGTALDFSTYLGGSGSETPRQVAVDSSDALYVMGQTNSGDYPVSVGAYQPSLKGGTDGFVTKLDSSGNSLIYSTYLGGALDETVSVDYGSIAVNSSGEALVCLLTDSSDYPTTAGVIKTKSLGAIDIAVTILNSTGTALLASTYWGGSDYDWGLAAWGADGSVYVTGFTWSSNLPITAGAYNTVNGSGIDGFVSRLGSGLRTCLYSTYITNGLTTPTAILPNTDGSAYVAGSTSNASFPTTTGAYQRTLNGNSNGFISKLSADGSTLLSSTYMGGGGTDTLTAMERTPSGALVFSGYTGTIGLPTTADAYQRNFGFGSVDLWLGVINADLTTLQYLTYLGGGSTEMSNALAVRDSVAILAGFSAGSSPTTSGVFQSTTPNATGDAGYIARFSMLPSAQVSVANVSGTIGAAVALTATVTAGGTALVGKSVAFTLGGASAGSATTDASGVATVSYTIPSSAVGGTKSIVAKFATDSEYTAGSGSGTLTINKHPSSLAVADVVGEIGKSVTLAATLTTDGVPVRSKGVSFTVGGVYAGYGVTNASGVAGITYSIPSGTSAGALAIGASMSADSQYTAATGSGTLTVRNVSSLAVSSASGEIGAGVTLSATLTTGGTGVSGKSVAFTVGGASAGSGTTDSSGVATVSYTIPSSAVSGTQSIGASFAADSGYAGSSGSSTLTITKHTPSLTVTDLAGEIGASVTLTAALADGGSGVADKTVAFTVDGVSAGSGITDASGTAAVSYSIPSSAVGGTLSIGAASASDSQYAAATGSGALTVDKHTPSLAVADVAGEIGAGVTLTATLTHGGSGLAGRSVSFTVDGQSVGTGTTNSSGVAAVDYTIPATAAGGTRAIGASVTSETQYSASTGSATLTVDRHTTAMSVIDVSGEIGTTVTLSATLTSGGAGLAGKTVAFTIGSVAAGTGTTDSSGVVTVAFALSSSLIAATATIGASSATDTQYAAASGTGVLTITKHPTTMAVADVSGEVGTAVTLSATLASRGAALSAKSISFFLDGVYLGKSNTNASGIATLSYSIPPSAIGGAKAIEATSATDSRYATVTGNGTLTVIKHATTLVAADASGEAGASVNLKATLTRNGSALMGRTIAFTVDGASAGTAITSSSGVATLKYAIPSSAVGGTEAIGASWSGDNQYAGSTGIGTLTVTLRTTSLAVAMPDAAAGSYSTITATLTAGASAVPGKAVSLSFNGAGVGTATTGSDGVASLRILVPSTTAVGTKSIAASFDGDTGYAAASATGTVVISAAQACGITCSATEWASNVTARPYAYLYAGTRPYTMVAGKTLHFTVDGVEEGTAVTDASGYAAVSITGLGVGVWPLVVTFDGDTTYAAASWTTTVTINAGTGVALYTGDQPEASPGVTVPLYAYIWNATTGALLSGCKVEFLVDGSLVGSGTSDSTGYAQVSYSVPAGATAGRHTITARHPADATYALGSNTGALTVSAKNATAMFVNDFRVAVGAQVKLYAYIWRKQGKAMLSGKTVRFSVNGSVVGSATSDSSGYARVLYTVKAGDTTILAEFTGDATSAASSATGRITNP